MALRVSLTQAQVDAACQFHKRLPQWILAEAALDKLQTTLPGYSAEDCLLKAVAVNAIYGTNVLAIARMANHVSRIMSRSEAIHTGVELVDEIANLPEITGELKKRRTSFAAKFCHFFVNPDRFPIYDDAACNALKLHLGAALTIDKTKPYKAFCENLARLRAESQLSSSQRDLDRYLWLTGMYIRLAKNLKKPLINAELLNIFRNPPPAAVAELDAMLPASLARAFKGEL